MDLFTTPSEDAILAVKRGAALLDEKRPGWYNDINLKELELSSKHSCVLGQLFAGEKVSVPAWFSYGFDSIDEVYEGFMDMDDLVHVTCSANYDAGRSILGLSRPACAENGFLAPAADGIPEQNESYEVRQARFAQAEVEYRDLDAAWAQVIFERQSGSA